MAVQAVNGNDVAALKKKKNAKKNGIRLRMSFFFTIFVPEFENIIMRKTFLVILVGLLSAVCAHAEMYACESKFPTQSNPYDQYFMTFLYLAQEESDEAVPQIGLEILIDGQMYILRGEKIYSVQGQVVK